MRRGPDYERPDPAWCPTCKRMVRPKETDFGIGPWEMHGRTGWHHDWCLACPDCESTKLEESEPEPETECRSCGEIAAVGDLGLCDSCVASIRLRVPGSRL